VRLRLRFLRRRDDGQALVELALALPFVLMPILFGIIDMGRAINDWNDTTNFANMAARVLAVGQLPSSGTCNPTSFSSFYTTTPPTVQQYVKCLASVENASLNGSGYALTTCAYTTTAAPSGAGNTPASGVGTNIQVNVSLTYNWIPILHIGASSPISASATMRIEQAYDPSTSSIISTNTSTC
jgi:Flp pilus assembly protein TadG